MKGIPYEHSSGNVFADMGFTPAAAAVLTVKSTLIMTIGDTIKERSLTQQEAAQLCGTDQPTLSKVLRGRMESVTIDKLTAWLNALGRTVESVFASMTVRPRPGSSSWLRKLRPSTSRSVTYGSIRIRGGAGGGPFLPRPPCPCLRYCEP